MSVKSDTDTMKKTFKNKNIVQKLEIPPKFNFEVLDCVELDNSFWTGT